MWHVVGCVMCARESNFEALSSGHVWRVEEGRNARMIAHHHCSVPFNLDNGGREQSDKAMRVKGHANISAHKSQTRCVSDIVSLSSYARD